jgi:hypothetical protein
MNQRRLLACGRAESLADLKNGYLESFCSVTCFGAYADTSYLPNSLLPLLTFGYLTE